jgi:hypothetical protein
MLGIVIVIIKKGSLNIILNTLNNIINFCYRIMLFLIFRKRSIYRILVKVDIVKNKYLIVIWKIENFLFIIVAYN